MSNPPFPRLVIGRAKKYDGTLGDLEWFVLQCDKRGSLFHPLRRCLNGPGIPFQNVAQDELPPPGFGFVAQGAVELEDSRGYRFVLGKDGIYHQVSPLPNKSAIDDQS